MLNNAPRKAKKVILAITLLVLALNGCKYSDVSGLVKEDEKKIAEKLITQLQTGEVDSLYSILSPNLQNDNVKETINKLQCLIPKEESTEYRYLKFTRQLTGEKKSIYLRIQTEYPSNIAFYDIGFARNGNQIELLNFHVNLTPQGSEITAPLLVKTLLHPLRLIFGILVFLVPLFTVYSIVLLFRTRNVKKKWGWFAFMLFGLGQFKLNWFAGTMKFSLVSFQILGSGFMSESNYGPLFVSFSIPLGAMLFLIKRKTLKFQIVEMPTKEIEEVQEKKEQDFKTGGE